MPRKIGTTRLPMTFQRIEEGWAAFADLVYVLNLSQGHGPVELVYVDHDVDEWRHLIRTTFEVVRA